MTVEQLEIRCVSGKGIRDLADLHVAAFQGFYLSSLGRSFLRRYYRNVVEFPGGICFGAYEGGRLLGAVAGFVDPPAFYAALRADRFRLALAALPALSANPRKALRFIRNYRRAGSAARRSSNETTAELASIGVHPACAGRGVGERLVRSFIAEAGRRGAATVMLTTDALGNDAVNRFYQKLGFELRQQFEASPGRLLNEYVSTAVSTRVGDAF